MAGPSLFDSNVFYRITNPSIGSNFVSSLLLDLISIVDLSNRVQNIRLATTRVQRLLKDDLRYLRKYMLTRFPALKSIDVANTASGLPIGTVDITPSGPFTGQMWQLLNLETTNNSSTYLLSSYYLGAEKKLFVTVGEDAIYVPFLTNFTNSPYDLSWVVSPSNGSGIGSANVTYSMSPTFLGGAQALSVNTVTKQPFLEDAGAGNNQQWEFKSVQYINDASFSATALSAKGTSVNFPLYTNNSGPNVN